MKYKKALVTGIVATSLTMAGVVHAATHPTTQQPEIQTTKSATVEPVQTKSSTVTQDVTPVNPPTTQSDQTSPVVTPVSQADQNKTQLQQLVTSKAQTIVPLLMVPTVSQNQIDAAVAMQWFCADKLITNSVGYDDYNNAYASSAIQMFVNSPAADGSYSIFTDMSCHIQNRLPQ